MIIKQEIEKAFGDSFSIYGASTLISRAIPSVEDGLTPVNRRILYSFYNENITSFKKAAYYVGVTLATSHPHGDMSLYDTMVGLAQWWKNQHTWIDPQGNIGTVQGKSAAAARYLELKLSNFSKEVLFEDIEKGVVNFVDNYDKTKKIPDVLPSKFPTILNAGMFGIAVGYSSNIPIHNVRDICNLTIGLIKNPDLSDKEVASLIQGPDFPTGGEILNASDLPSIYAKGRGNILVRGVIKEEVVGKETVLVVRELPPNTTTDRVVEAITALCREKEEKGKKVPGLLQTRIAEVKDFTKGKEVEIVIYPKKDTDINILKNMILENCCMSDTYNYMMNILIEGKFNVEVSLKKVIQEWLTFRKEVIRRKFKSLVSKSLERQFYLNALITALKNIDALIRLSKKSKTKEELVEGLKKEFSFSERASKYISEQPLYRLTSFEIKKLEDELAQKKKESDEYTSILRDSNRIEKIILTELEAVKKKYGEDRKTKLLNVSKVETLDLIENKSLVVAITSEGYIFSKEVDDVNEGKKGNKGRLFVESKKGRSIEKTLTLDSHDEVFIFSECGKMFKGFGYEFDVNGTHVSSIIKGFEGKTLCEFIKVSHSTAGNLIFVTSSSLTKRVPLEDFRTRMPAEGLLAVNVTDNNEKLVGVFLSETPDEDLVVISTSRGYASKIMVSNLPLQARPSMGRKMIRMKEESEVCVSLVGSKIKDSDNELVLFITNKGIGKFVCMSDLLEKRTANGQGASFLAIKLKLEDKLRKNVVCSKDDQLIVSTRAGKTIRIDAGSVKQISREAIGGKIISINADDEVASIAVV